MCQIDLASSLLHVFSTSRTLNTQTLDLKKKNAQLVTQYWHEGSLKFSLYYKANIISLTEVRPGNFCLNVPLLY